MPLLQDKCLLPHFERRVICLFYFYCTSSSDSFSFHAWLYLRRLERGSDTLSFLTLLVIIELICNTRHSRQEVEESSSWSWETDKDSGTSFLSTTCDLTIQTVFVLSTKSHELCERTPSEQQYLQQLFRHTLLCQDFLRMKTQSVSFMMQEKSVKSKPPTSFPAEKEHL